MSASAVSAAERDLLRVAADPIDLGDLTRTLTDPACGALASFVGTVRSPNLGQRVRYIDYQGYEGMMLREMAAIAHELRGAHAVARIALVHRLGRLEPGDASIAVVVAAAHRRDALEACREGIEACKRRLPVWKYEVGERDEGYVAGRNDAATPL